MIILCPLAKDLRDAPGHLLFGSNYFESSGRQLNNNDIKVLYIYYKPRYSSFGFLYFSLILTIRIIFTKHDILYFTTDPNCLFILSLFKYFRLYNKKMYAWKYIALHGLGVKKKILKLFYKSFDMIFMITESHVQESINSNIISKDKISYMKWGEDLNYIRKFRSIEKDNTSNKVIFISSGKAYRDFHTLCMAFEGLDNAILRIITSKKWGGIDYEEQLSNYRFNNIQVVYTDDLLNEGPSYILDYIFTEIHKSHCSIVCCKPVNFGVGFTQVIDSLACSVPVIITANKDNPIDVDLMNVGITVSPNSISDLRKVVIQIINNVHSLNIMSLNARILIENEYNICITSKKVLMKILDIGE